MNVKYLFAIVAAGAVAVAAYFVSAHNDAGDPKTAPPPVVQVKKERGKAYAPIDKSRLAALEKYLPKSLGKERVVEPPFTPEASMDNPQKVVAEAEGPAKNGSASAMYWMSAALKKCSKVDKGSNEQIEEKAARKSIGREAMQRDSGQPPMDADAIVKEAADEAQMKETLRDECAKLPADQVADWQSWLEKSAAAGSGKARAVLSLSVKDKFTDPEYMQENYDEFSRENNLATQYLQDSVSNGDCDENILGGFSFLQMDTTNKYIYQSLMLKHYLDYFSNHPETSEAVLNRETSSINAMLQSLADEVPQDQFADAEAASNYILGNVCRNF
jgi:hypothetical protein